MSSPHLIPSLREGVSDPLLRPTHQVGHSPAGLRISDRMRMIWRRDHRLFAFVLLFGLAILWEFTAAPSRAMGVLSKLSFTPLTIINKPAAPLDRLAYRAQLEASHGPHNFSIDGSSTLGFDNIYVLSLPSAVRNRVQMSKLAKAHGLSMQTFDATGKNLPVINWIADRVLEGKGVRAPTLAATLGRAPNSIGGQGVTTPWLQDKAVDKGYDFPEEWNARWHSAGRARNWIEYLATMNTSGIVENATEQQIKDKLRNPAERDPNYQMSAGMIACFYSHLLIWQDMLAKGHSTALILEDDIDMEWDMDRHVPNIMRVLPADWDIVYFGHCYSKAATRQSIFTCSWDLS